MFPVLAVVRSWLTPVISRLQEFWWSVFVGTNCRAYCSSPRGIRTQDFEFPGCCDGTCPSITEVPADLDASTPVVGPILS